MAEIVELDLENHVAVVQPGVTLAQLDEATKAVGMVYPVFPGENSASLGGNVATNAGGMRAVRYGVTRHQVLGLTAVLGTGEVIRTGGKFVKGSSGYDLTQLIIGSEGTLALATEAILRLHPRLTHGATVLIPFPGLDEVSAAVPRIVGSGLMPTILEYIDFITMSAITAAQNLELGVPQEIKDAAMAYLVVVLENRSEDRVDEDVQELAELATDLGALDLYVLPAHAGAGAHRRPREGVLDGQGQQRRRHHRHGGAPRRHPRLPHQGAGGRRRHRLAGGGLRPRRRRQRAPLGLPARPGGAHRRGRAASCAPAPTSAAP
jgi:glycolate oxidase